MTKKKLLNEQTIRRWGKLANIAPLTENFLEEEDFVTEQEDEEGAEDMGAEAEEAGDEMDAGADAEASPEMEAQVEDIVSAVVDALAQETGVDIEMDAGGDDEGGEEEAGEEDDAEAMMRDKDAMMRDKEPMGRDPMARDRDPMMREEGLDIEVVDDEQLTEAVLQRVVERLLKRK
mgnify:CR=1 FL=1